MPRHCYTEMLKKAGTVKTNLVSAADPGNPALTYEETTLPTRMVRTEISANRARLGCDDVHDFPSRSSNKIKYLSTLLTSDTKENVQKNSVPHQGMADFEATSNGVKTAIRVVVSDNIGDNMLIAYQEKEKNGP